MPLQSLFRNIFDKQFRLLCLACIAICSVTGLLSSLHWSFDLFNHFRPQAVIAAAFFLIVEILSKNRSGIVLSVLIIALNVSLMAGRIYAFERLPSVAPAARTTVSVISSNVYTPNKNHEALVNLIKKYQPDIFVATEVDDSWITGLKPIESDYPYSRKFPRPDNFGMAVYSKIPFTGDVFSIGEYKLPLMKLDFESFTLLTAHPIPPTSRQKNALENNHYINELSNISQTTKKPLIVVGDMNATLWSDSIRPFLSAGLKPANRGLIWTWPVGILPLAIQIDHIFTRDAIARDFKKLEAIGSDHYPVAALVDIPTPEKQKHPRH